MLAIARSFPRIAAPLARRMSSSAPVELTLNRINFQKLKPGETLVFDIKKLHNKSGWLNSQFKNLGTDTFNILIVSNHTAEIKVTTSIQELGNIKPCDSKGLFLPKVTVAAQKQLAYELSRLNNHRVIFTKV